jgi:hypothetical protein
MLRESNASSQVQTASIKNHKFVQFSTYSIWKLINSTAEHWCKQRFMWDLRRFSVGLEFAMTVDSLFRLHVTGSDDESISDTLQPFPLACGPA